MGYGKPFGERVLRQGYTVERFYVHKNKVNSQIVYSKERE